MTTHRLTTKLTDISRRNLELFIWSITRNERKIYEQF
jgi:hypothetical protein